MLTDIKVTSHWITCICEGFACLYSQGTKVELMFRVIPFLSFKCLIGFFKISCFPRLSQDLIISYLLQHHFQSSRLQVFPLKSVYIIRLDWCWPRWFLKSTSPLRKRLAWPAAVRKCGPLESPPASPSPLWKLTMHTAY